MNNYLGLKRKNIFQASNRNFVISSLTITCILIVMILMLIPYLKESEDIWIFFFGTILITWGGAFVIAIIVAVKEIRKYNYLLEHGKIVEGKIISYSTHIQQGVTVKATYCDEKNGREYIYISKSPTVILFNMRYFVHQDPSINLLIDEKDMRNGVVLIDEYYNEKQEKYGDEPYQLRKIFKR